MDLVVLGGILAVSIIASGLDMLIDFVKEKRRVRSRLDPEGNVLLPNDSALIDRMAETIRQNFTGDIGTELRNMTFEERKDKMEAIARQIARDIGIGDIEIEFYNTQDTGCKYQGSYCFANNKLSINEDYLKITDDEILFDALDTVVHELSHAYQHKKMSELLERIYDAEDENDITYSEEDKRTCIWIINQKPGNYIKFEVDPEGYRKQPLEWYAFAMANAALRKLGGEE
ncbi:hypothetical protein GPL15_23335 [Clostridium sp. MCC353]|uniref:hypothetical protein n=1 Tax=Clostridium sp. MCC353 TaxID=2592646 RepID=UPI001C024AA1|nr:hypothetical protein [Clostridium sp. MCC353]MBT9779415.1 hypothetical protein [Clostridium sp. MCC353]